MSDSLPKSKSTLPSRTILSLLLGIAAYAAPRGNKQMRYRIIGAFTCLVLAKSSNIITPLLYGGAVDYVNGDAGFSTLVLWYILGAYALSRLGQQIFSEGKEYLFSRVAQRARGGNDGIPAFAFIVDALSFGPANWRVDPCD